MLALGADWLLRGVVLGVGGGRDVSFSLVDREGGEVHGRLSLASAEGAGRQGDEVRAREVFRGVWAGRPLPQAVKGGGGVWPTVLLAAGGVALAAGVGFGLAARRADADLSTGGGGCEGEGAAFRDCFSARLAQGRQRALAANALFGAGALLGAGGTVLLVWTLP